MSIRKIVFLIAFCVMNYFTYYYIRRMLWSIVHLFVGGNGNKFIKYKKELRKERPLPEFVSMRFLADTLPDFRKEFLRWWRFKRVFALLEVLIALAYIGACLYSGHEDLMHAEDMVLSIQSLVFFIFMRFQFGVSGRYTLYDRMRMEKHRH